MRALDTVRALSRVEGAPAYARRLEPGRTAWHASDLAEAQALAGRIAAIIGGASEAQRRDGVLWYGAAADAVLSAVPGFGLDVLSRALAAVSPGMPWDRNVEALRALSTVDALEDVRAAVLRARLPVSYGYRPFRAAWQALQGLDVLRGPKVQAFALGIESRGTTAHVCVDGHAVLAAEFGPVAVRPGITSARAPTGRRYDLLALAYALAAARVGLEPAQAQAVAWIAWRSIPTA